MQWADEKAEAGRFYLLLVLTWCLLYLAVVTGLCTFIASGLAVHSQHWVVVAPLAPGISLLAAGLLLLVRRFMSLYPGWDALKKALVFMVFPSRRPLRLAASEDLSWGRSAHEWKVAVARCCAAFQASILCAWPWFCADVVCMPLCYSVLLHSIPC
jgi:hypothetical protein